MISDIKINTPRTGKRKRIPMHPSLQKGNLYKNEELKMPDDLDQNHDQDDADLVLHYRINARLEEERQRDFLFQSSTV